MGKKPTVSATYENERISIKNSLPYLKCVLHLSCVVHGPIYGRFMGFYVNGRLSIKRSTKVGHSSEAARLIHRRKMAGNSLQLLQSPPNSAWVTHDSSPFYLLSCFKTPLHRERIKGHKSLQPFLSEAID